MVAGATVEAVKEKWKLDYDMLDFELARSQYNGKYFLLTPFAGLKGGWIDQHLEVTLDTPTDVRVMNIARGKSDSWLVGIRGGLYSQLMLGEGFSFLGKASGSLLYQRFSNLKLTQDAPGQVTGFATNLTKPKYSNVAPIFELMLGLNWGTYFDRNNWHFDLFAGYELQYLWGQNILSREKQVINAVAEDLMFHGLTITARLDF